MKQLLKTIDPQGAARFYVDGRRVRRAVYEAILNASDLDTMQTIGRGERWLHYSMARPRR